MSDSGYEGYRAWKSWETQTFAKCDDESAAYFASEVAACGLCDLSGARILEIGFGNAEFATWVTLRGAHYTGFEVISELVELGRARGFNTFLADVPIVDVIAAESLDLVVAFDVFEHLEIEELRSLLQDAKLCLRKGGHLMARMPSGDSPFSRAIQHGDLTHKTTLGSSAIRQLALTAGFEVMAVRAPSFPLKGGGWRSFHRRLAIATSRALIYRFVSLVLMGGGDPVLSPNMLCVLRKS